MNFPWKKSLVDPYEGKELTSSLPIQTIDPVGDLAFAMSQHIGAPAVPAVAKGDRVLVGQIIGECGKGLCCPIVSSVSGTVKAIETRTVAKGAKSNCIIVANDGLYETVPGFGEKRDYTKMSKEEIRAAVKNAGIVGLGGAGFPTYIKLSPTDAERKPSDDKIDYIIANGAECEPYLTSNHRSMLEQSDKLIGGLKILMQLFPNAKCVIAIEENKPDAIKHLQEKTASEDKISVQVLPASYPQGAERALIYNVTGRKIYSAKLPAAAGCIVDNIDTLIAIYEAVAESTPLIYTTVTVTGDGIKNPCNYRVRIGSSVNNLFEAAGGFKDGVVTEKIVYGGPMTGSALYNFDIPVTKTSSGMIFMTHDQVAAATPTPCIRCGRCINACPNNLVPQMLMQLSLKHDYEGFQKAHGMECYSCGSCAYVCPAKRPLTQTFDQMKVFVKMQPKK